MGVGYECGETSEPVADEWRAMMATVTGTRAEMLPAPSALAARLPVGPVAQTRIAAQRHAIRSVVAGVDDRLLVVVGPCSVHDPSAALDYATRLAAVAEQHSGELLIVLRSYLEKPRTELGWKGLLHDPGLAGEEDPVRGLEAGREFLVRAVETGLPLAYEFVDPFFAPFVADLVSWGAIGARTVCSQPHRQLAAGLPFSVGMKNAVDGDVSVAVSAVRAASAGHRSPGIRPDGRLAVLATVGNPSCHVVLRGGRTPNYDADSIESAVRLLEDRGLPGRVMVDASHANSGKDHRRQRAVVAELADQVALAGSELFGIMVESFVEEGSQALPPGGRGLRYGVSVTDACIGWPETETCLKELADAVRSRRSRSKR